MGVPRAGKKKSKGKPKATPADITKMSHYVNMAVAVRTMATVFDFDDERMADYVESYLALMEEIGDGRSNPWQLIADTREMTGVDVVKLIDSL